MLTRTINASWLVSLSFVTALSVEPFARADTNTVTGGGAGSALTANESDTATGFNSMHSTTTGHDNTATGRSAMFSFKTGNFNTATGSSALYGSNSTGSENTATGYYAASANTTGTDNTAEGMNALLSNTSGSFNCALGAYALASSQTTNDLTAVGAYSLYNNTSGIENTALGYQTLYTNVIGNDNTAVGDGALSGSDGSWNTAVGALALNIVCIGVANTAIGAFALESSSGDSNVAVGEAALIDLQHGDQNTAVGAAALFNMQTGNQNTAVGAASFPADGLTNSGAFGYAANPTLNNQIVIGNTSITKIQGAVTFTQLSDARFKKDVQENVPGLAFISKLRPVTFHWDMRKLNAADALKALDTPTIQAAALDKERKQYTGFLAQEVEDAARQCSYDFSGVVSPENDKSHYQLGYSEFVVPLVKAVQEQQAEIEELRGTVASLKTRLGDAPQRAGIFGNYAGDALPVLGLALALAFLARSKRVPAARAAS